jgi:hypothetical protein
MEIERKTKKNVYYNIKFPECELMKNMSSNEGAGNANPKLPVKLM